MRKLTTTEWVCRAKEKHGNVYDYSCSVYVNMRTKIRIGCPLHGEFEQFPFDHINGSGCPKCGFEKTRNNNWKGQNQSGLVEGMGVNDMPFPNNSQAYLVWHNVLRRCYNPRVQERQPMYKGCKVCDEWLVFSNFKAWFENPENGYREGYQLDKDIIIKGNKIYSPETCCFVPQAINCLFGYNSNKASNLPYGVYLNNGKFRAILHRSGRNISLGAFDAPEDAFAVYKQAKEAYVKEIANAYFQRKEITPKVFNALMNYEIG